MKRMLRNMLAFLLLIPFLSRYTWLRMTKGKSVATSLIGTRFTGTALHVLRKTVPILNSSDEFDNFYPQIQKTMNICHLIWDFQIHNTKNSVKVKISHCPVIDVLRLFKLEELNPHVCQGDWEFAKENTHAWKFEREHEIGKGDSYCDHTYIRLSEI